MSKNIAVVLHVNHKTKDHLKLTSQVKDLKQSQVERALTGKHHAFLLIIFSMKGKVLSVSGQKKMPHNAIPFEEYFSQVANQQLN